jgi:Protein of unknown function (DUF3455)
MSVAGLAYPTTQIPTDIAAPAPNDQFLTGHVVGVQTYACNATVGGCAWSTSSTPRADLRGDNGKLVATHYAGPTWRALDGSTVIGRREAGVTVDSDAIPWLRLAASSTAAGMEAAGSSARPASCASTPPAVSCRRRRIATR